MLVSTLSMFKRLSVVLFVDSWTLFSVSPSVFTSLEHSNSDSNKTLIVFVHLSIYLHLYLSIIVPIVFSYVLLCLYLSLFPFLVFLSFCVCSPTSIPIRVWSQWVVSTRRCQQNWIPKAAPFINTFALMELQLLIPTQKPEIFSELTGER